MLCVTSKFNGKHWQISDFANPGGEFMKTSVILFTEHAIASLWIIKIDNSFYQFVAHSGWNATLIFWNLPCKNYPSPKCSSRIGKCRLIGLRESPLNCVAAMLDNRTFYFAIQHGCHAIVFLDLYVIWTSTFRVSSVNFMTFSNSFAKVLVLVLNISESRSFITEIRKLFNGLIN